MEITFDYEIEVSAINELLRKISDSDDKEHTVIMAPDIGKTDKRNYKLRVYSYGGRILELTTQRKAKNCYFPNKSYLLDKKGGRSKYIPDMWDTKTFNKVKEKRGAQKYENIKMKDLENAIEIAKKRAKDVHAEERSLENYLVYRNRQTSCKGTIIDMEFNCPFCWLAKGNFKIDSDFDSHTGKPDLIVYDSDTQSFGLVELKYKNESTENIDKHFIDFYNIINGSSKEIKYEFIRKLVYLRHYGLINNDVTCEMLHRAFECNNNIWAGFLFVDGKREDSEKIFNRGIDVFKEEVKKERNKGKKLNTIKFGFCYYETKEKVNDLGKDKFSFIEA